MQEGGAAHRPDLTVAEEPAQRQGAHPLPEQVGVMVGVAVEVLTSSQAGEEQRSFVLLPFKPMGSPP